MEYTVEPWSVVQEWTTIGETGVQLRYEGSEAQTVRIDDQGAVILPAYDPLAEAFGSLWMAQPGDVPVTREGEPFLLDQPQFWPGGYTLVDGKWRPA